MFISNVSRKEEIRELALKHLRQQGIKYKLKKRSQQQVAIYKSKCFGVPLANLKTEIATLANGQQLLIPKILGEMIQFIMKTDPEKEGIFRLSGRMENINKLKESLEKGQTIPIDENVINVAALLKRFFKELPESLIPPSHQEVFLSCLTHSNKLELVLLTCLLLPSEYVNVLAYLMTFLHEISLSSEMNKMTSYNLAVCFGPTLVASDQKGTNPAIIEKQIELLDLMIVNANSLGIIPEEIINETGQLGHENPKKRRSSSLTRMFSGLRKIVGKSGDGGPDGGGITMSRVITPDLLLTPSINRTCTPDRSRSKKRRTDLSAKKKKELVERMPQARLLSTPFTPSTTPIHSNPNPKKTLSSHHSLEDIIHRNSEKEKKSSVWYNRSRSVKNLKEPEETEFKEKRRNSLMGSRAMLERRWSQVSQVANFRKKKRNSCVALQIQKEDEQTDKEADYVRVSKEEYEEIKNRVTEIERRISMELDCVVRNNEHKENRSSEVVQNIEQVINAYEQTLEKSEPMSPTTDHLARRLSKDLRIRRSSENKVIRSPSARKIGSIRRRSKERERHGRVTRHQSWHVHNENTNVSIPRAHFTKQSIRKPEQHLSNRPVTRSTSFQGPFETPPQLQINQVKKSCNTSGGSSSTCDWVSGEAFFSTMKTPKNMSAPSNNSANGRASIAKLRTQNAGMVLAKAKLFDNLQDSDATDNPANSSSILNKTGPSKVADARMSLRVKNLRVEERTTKKNTSPRRRQAHVHKSKIYMNRERAQEEYNNNLDKKRYVSPLREVNRLLGNQVNSPKGTPKTIPHIKKTLNVRSPKRLCKTPLGVDKRTPLKVLTKPKCEF